jgi:hypothetical protein
MSVCHPAPNRRPTPPPGASSFRPRWPPIFAHKAQNDCRPNFADTDVRRNALYGESSGQSSRIRQRRGMMVSSKRPQRGGEGGGARSHRGRGTPCQRRALLPVGTDLLTLLDELSEVAVAWRVEELRTGSAIARVVPPPGSEEGRWLRLAVSSVSEVRRAPGFPTSGALAVGSTLTSEVIPATYVSPSSTKHGYQTGLRP